MVGYGLVLRSLDDDHLRQPLGSIALIRLDRHPVDQLRILVRRPYDHPIPDDRQSREALARSKLARPRTADHIITAGYLGVRCVRPVRLIAAVRCVGAVVLIDIEADPAFGVFFVAFALYPYNQQTWPGG